MKEIAHHKHRRSLKDTNGDQERSCVSHCVCLGYQHHDISAYPSYTTSDDEISAILELIRSVYCPENCYKGSRIG
jgi:hypothetical protein